MIQVRTPEPRTPEPRRPERVESPLARPGDDAPGIARELDYALLAAVTRVAQLWRDGPLRTAAMLAGVALVTYLVVGGARNGSNSGTQTILAPAAALPAAAPITVEQLNGARQPRENAMESLRVEQPDRPRSRSASSHAREASSAEPVSKSGGYQTIAPVQSKAKSRRSERASTSAQSSSAGLPAWGTEAVREFSGAKTSSNAAPVSGRSQALTTAKPPASNTGIPPPMAAYRPTPAAATVPAREQTKPAPGAAAKPVIAAKPVAPTPPSKPLTMDQVLNQVEEAAQSQRKKDGLKTPKSSKRDAELDELISGTMKSKK